MNKKIDSLSLVGKPLAAIIANNIRCKNGGSVSFYSNGKLESCVLSAEVNIAKSKCKADGLISFYIDGKLKSCMKQDN
ncbi:MAG: hypothetical protein STSR0002_22600 [Smithella sp.]|jgi:antitoxin component YwqK of YwqJK toxin-antitoxin module